jgi:threonylcarbamoyladenosine tRNA methylthiotransferase MtaB
MGKVIRIFYRSLGCKVNLADLSRVIQRLDPTVFCLTPDPHNADLVILNTCTVTHKADRDARKILGSLLRDHPHLPVIVTGCGAVNHGQELGSQPNVRALVLPGDLDSIVAAIFEAAGFEPPGGDPAQDTSAFERMNRRRAFVKIQDGCNAGCTYCVIPRVRGRERSIPPARALEQIDRFIELGHREVVLCGIHLGRYGREEGSSLAALLRALAPRFERLGAGCRVRLSSIEPLEWSDELLAVLAGSPFVCSHFHVPLQSGDDDVLQRMRRPYRASRFRKVVERLHADFPRAAIGTDVLVGFPGETDQAAGNTLGLVTDLPLSYLHVFTFSAREGTPAASMTGRVDPKKVRHRAAELRKISESRWLSFLKRGVGRRHRLLAERAGPDGVQGRTDSYRKMRIPEGRPGEIVQATAKNLDGDTLVGVLCGDDASDRDGSNE